MAATCIAAISEDRLQKSVFPHVSKGLFPPPLLSVLSEKSHHHPWIKFVRIKHGRGRMRRCTFSPLLCDEANANGKRISLDSPVIGIYLLRKLLG